MHAGNLFLISFRWFGWKFLIDNNGIESYNNVIFPSFLDVRLLPFDREKWQKELSKIIIVWEKRYLINYFTLSDKFVL